MLLVLLFAAQAAVAPPAAEVVRENLRPGSTDWELSSPALNREIEGYASAVSVNRGADVELFVNTPDPTYSIDVFRMGWYNGDGARRVAGPIDRTGLVQPGPDRDPDTGLIECRWRDPYRLTTGDAGGPWTTGVYLARLTAHPSSKQSFIVFVVRDDDSRAALLFQSSVATFAAYDNWGGASLYAFNSHDSPARAVSFDRPYAADPYGVRLDGAGDFLRRWEYNAVRFLERSGYDVAYTTDVDTDRQPDALVRHRVFLSVGHDEYWSAPIRNGLDRARDRGVHLAFLGADAGYWQVRFEPDAAGVPGRRVVSYKEAAADHDPLALDGDPSNDRLITTRWRDRPVSRPENRLVGVMYLSDPVDGDIVVDDAAHWAFAGTGLANGSRLPGLLGYEVDAIYDGGPRGLERLAHSPFLDAGSHGVQFADMTIYTAASGAIVFATGSMQWNWGLDGYNAPAWHTNRTSDAAQRVTRNILDRMLATPTTPAPPPSRSGPSAIVIAAIVIAAIVVSRAWIKRPPRDMAG